MPRQQEMQRWNATPSQFPIAGLMRTQNIAVQNATRMTDQVSHYATTMNRAWFNLWSTMLTDFAALPMRFTSAQIDFIGDVLKGFEDTSQGLGGLTRQVEQAAESAWQETAQQARRTVTQMSQAADQAGTTQRASEPRRQRNQRSQQQAGKKESQAH